jgi:hypothetical protein
VACGKQSSHKSQENKINCFNLIFGGGFFYENPWQKIGILEKDFLQLEGCSPPTPKSLEIKIFEFIEIALDLRPTFFWKQQFFIDHKIIYFLLIFLAFL